MLESVDLMLEDRQGVRSDKFGKMNFTKRGITRKKQSASEGQKTLHEEDEPVTSIFMRMGAEVGARGKATAETAAYRTRNFQQGGLWGDGDGIDRSTREGGMEKS